jgi:hypothetical protein
MSIFFYDKISAYSVSGVRGTWGELLSSSTIVVGVGEGVDVGVGVIII